MKTLKVVIHPNNKQATKIKKTMNKCIEAYNFIVDYLDGFINRNEKIPQVLEVRKYFTKAKAKLDEETINKRIGLTKEEIRYKGYDTLFYDVSNDALKQVVKDCYNAYVRWFKKLAKRPVKKEYGKYPKGFYVDPFKIEFSENKVRLEKIANNQKENRQILNYIKLAEKNRIPTNVKYYNPRISYDGYRFYITVGVEDKDYPSKKHIEQPVQCSDEVIGIDMNVSNITLSNGVVYKNITSTTKVKKIERRKKRLERAKSRKYENHKVSKKKLSTCRNYIKDKRRIHTLQQRLNNLKDNSYKEIIKSIVRSRPKHINIEDLDIKKMQQNKLVSKYIQKIGIGRFYLSLYEECNKQNIEITKVGRYYPSSKKCCVCGNIKKILLLSERTYKCNVCNNIINRDLNAAINIANYK